MNNVSRGEYYLTKFGRYYSTNPLCMAILLLRNRDEKTLPIEVGV